MDGLKYCSDKPSHTVKYNILYIPITKYRFILQIARLIIIFLCLSFSILYNKNTRYSIYLRPTTNFALSYDICRRLNFIKCGGYTFAFLLLLSFYANHPSNEKIPFNIINLVRFIFFYLPIQIAFKSTAILCLYQDQHSHLANVHRPLSPPVDVHNCVSDATISADSENYWHYFD